MLLNPSQNVKTLAPKVCCSYTVTSNFGTAPNFASPYLTHFSIVSIKRGNLRSTTTLSNCNRIKWSFIPSYCRKKNPKRIVVSRNTNCVRTFSGSAAAVAGKGAAVVLDFLHWVCWNTLLTYLGTVNSFMMKRVIVVAELKPNSITLASSELAPNKLRTSFERAPN